MKIKIPLEITVDWKPTKKPKKDIKQITKWLSDDLKNLYIPYGPRNYDATVDITATVKKIKIGEIK